MSHTVKVTLSLAHTSEATIDFLAALAGVSFETENEAQHAAEILLEELYQRNCYDAEVSIDTVGGFTLKVTEPLEQRDVTSAELLGDYYAVRFLNSDEAEAAAQSIRELVPPGYEVLVEAM